MNKKAYISPETLVTIVKLSAMISTSLGSTNVEGLGYGGDSGTAGVSEAAVKSDYNVWNDDRSD